MQSLPVHLNYYTVFFKFRIRKEKCQVYQQKKGEQNLILMI